MITKLQLDQSATLADLHYTHLATPFRGTPGKELLKLYYQAISKSYGACGYVAYDKDRILGYVCGIWDAALLKQNLLKHDWFRLAFWTTLQLIIKPCFITGLFSRFREPAQSINQNKDTYELRPIVVVPEARGSGLSARLVETLIKDADERGFPEIFLITEKNNLIANKFYQKFGFDLVGQEIRFGKIYLRYKHMTGLVV